MGESYNLNGDEMLSAATDDQATFLSAIDMLKAVYERVIPTIDDSGEIDLAQSVGATDHLPAVNTATKALTRIVLESHHSYTDSLNTIAALVLRQNASFDQIVTDVGIQVSQAKRWIGHLRSSELIVSVRARRNPEVVGAHYEPMPQLEAAAADPESYPRLAAALMLLQTGSLSFPDDTQTP